MIKKYTDFEKIDEANTDAKGLKIRGLETEVINDPKANAIDLGVVDDVSDTDITNIQQTYKNSSIHIADGHYILMIEEGTIIKYSDFERLDENVLDNLKDFFSNAKREPEVSEDIYKVLHQENGIASYLGLDEPKEPRPYDQILFAYDNDGFDSLKDEWKTDFIKMVDMADVITKG